MNEWMLYCRLGWSISGTKGRQYQIFLDTRFKNKNTMQSTNVREIYQKNERYTIYRYRYSAFPCGSFLPTNAWSDSVSSFTSDWATVLKR